MPKYKILGKIPRGGDTVPRTADAAGLEQWTLQVRGYRSGGCLVAPPRGGDMRHAVNEFATMWPRVRLTHAIRNLIQHLRRPINLQHGCRRSTEQAAPELP